MHSMSCCLMHHAAGQLHTFIQCVAEAEATAGEQPPALPAYCVTVLSYSCMCALAHALDSRSNMWRVPFSGYSTHS
jgi:hypothetical protein